MENLKEANYQYGDMVGVEGGNMSQLSEAIFEPPTRLYHFLVIDRYIESEGDYEIHEAIASGVRSGRLSWYKDDLYVVFRHNALLGDEYVAGLGEQACEKASDFGRWGYDYLMYLYLLYDVPRVVLRNLVKERRLRRIRPDELPYRENHDSAICTVFANFVWRQVGFPVMGRVPALPAGYIQAYYDRRLRIVGGNVPAGRQFKNLDTLPTYMAVLVKFCQEREAARGK